MLLTGLKLSQSPQQNGDGTKHPSPLMDTMAFLIRSCMYDWSAQSIWKSYSIPSNTLFVISFARRSGYTIVGKAKNIFLIVNVEMRIPASTQTQN